MQWNVLVAVQNGVEQATDVEIGEALSGLLLLLAGGYGIYLWLNWMQGILKRDATATPACFQHTRTKPGRRPVPLAPAVIGAFWIATNLFMLLGNSSGGSIQPDNLPEFQALLIQLVGLPLGVAGFLLLVWEFSGPRYELKNYFQFDHWKEDIQAGAELWLLAMPPTLVLGMLSSFWKTPDDLHLLLQILRGGADPAVIGLIFVSAAMVAPIVEELLFRVLLLNGLIQHGRLTVSLSVVLTAALFSIAHGAYDALQLLPLSLCLTWSSARRESYMTVVTAHALFNGFMLLLTLMMVSSG